MKIEIHTHDRRLVSDFLERPSISINDEVQISDNAVLKPTFRTSERLNFGIYSVPPGSIIHP
jgi:hypothetical protein